MQEWETQPKSHVNIETHLQLRALPTLTCNGWTNCHRHWHEPKQKSDGLGDILSPNELEGNRSHNANEAPVEQAHEETDSNESSKDIAQWNHHRHQPNKKEWGHLNTNKEKNIKMLCIKFANLTGPDEPRCICSELNCLPVFTFNINHLHGLPPSEVTYQDKTNTYNSWQANKFYYPFHGLWKCNCNPLSYSDCVRSFLMH